MGRVMKFACFLGAGSLITLMIASVSLDVQAQPASKPVSQTAPASAINSFEGVVEAERQTVIAAQVSGAIVEILTKAGDHVRAGQLLLRIDAHAAAQAAAASKERVISAQANAELARKDFERQRQLFSRGYISQAALDHADARLKAAGADANAQIAQAGAAETQAGYYTIRAPYAGVIAEIPVSPGGMAMPGQPLLTMYDPTALRVTSTIPQSAVGHELPVSMVSVEITGMSGIQRLSPTHIKILPTIDAGTHTAQIRLALPANLSEAVPGMFARVWLPTYEQAIQSVRIPMTALVRRAEMTGVYVLDGKNQPLLRQVRVGRIAGGQVEILSGISADEHVVQDAESALSAAVH